MENFSRPRWHSGQTLQTAVMVVSASVPSVLILLHSRIEHYWYFSAKTDFWSRISKNWSKFIIMVGFRFWHAHHQIMPVFFPSVLIWTLERETVPWKSGWFEYERLKYKQGNKLYFCGWKRLMNACTAWCSEIGSLRSLDAPELHAYSDVREPISLHQAVDLHAVIFSIVRISWYIPEW